MLKKSIIKDYFNVPQLEIHGLHHVDDYPYKLNQTIRYTFSIWRGINKNFAGSSLLANICSMFSMTNLADIQYN